MYSSQRFSCSYALLCGEGKDRYLFPDSKTGFAFYEIRTTCAGTFETEKGERLCL